MATPDQDDDWGSWKRLVLTKLDQHGEVLEKLDTKIQAIRVEDIGKLRMDVVALKVKAGIWGVIGGAIPAIVIAFVTYMKTAK